MVEGVSVAAMAYYLMGLLDYVLNAIKSSGFSVNKVMVKGFAVPIILISTWLLVRIAIRYINKGKD